MLMWLRSSKAARTLYVPSATGAYKIRLLDRPARSTVQPRLCQSHDRGSFPLSSLECLDLRETFEWSSQPGLNNLSPVSMQPARANVDEL